MKQLKLPSGKNVKIQDGKGYHLLQAQRKAKNTDEIPYALIAELSEFEGQKIPYEDILQFSLNDVSSLLNVVNEVSEGKSSNQEQSSSSAQQQTPHYKK